MSNNKGTPTKIGDVYGKLTVLEIVNRHNVLCLCACGSKFNTWLRSLRSGNTKSCGCLRKEVRIGNKNSFKHGLTGNPIAGVYHNMIRRCYNVESEKYQIYGGRGIKVCEEWRASIEKFAEWAFSNGFDPKLQLDRKDNNGDYCPENCRFVSQSINCLNKNKYSNNTSGFIGVGRSGENWYYRLQVDKVNYYKSGFKTALAAAKGRDSFIRANKIPTTLNFPNEA